MNEGVHTRTPVPPSQASAGMADIPSPTAESSEFRWSHIFVELNSANDILQPIKSSSRLKYTSIDVSDRYIAVGSSTGAVYIFDKESLKWLHHLTSDQEGSVTQLRFSPDDNILAHVCSNGNVTVTELNIQKRSGPRRLRLSPDHKGSRVTALEWNISGTQLFIGDDVGRVSMTKVTTSIAKDILQVPSEMIMRLGGNMKIVQLSLFEDKLLVSTYQKTFLCNTVKRQFFYIGQRDRNGPYGSTFFHWPRGQPPMILCARPKSFVWQVDIDGLVTNTLKFKEILNIPSLPIPSFREENVIFPNPEEQCTPHTIGFNKLLQFSDKFVLTWSNDGLYVFNPHQPSSMFWTRFTDILDFSVCKNEIFILKSSCRVTKLYFLTAEKSVKKLFQRGLWKQCASVATFFKPLIRPVFARKLVPRALLVTLCEELKNNGYQDHLKCIETLLVDIEEEVEMNSGRRAEPQHEIQVLQSGIHIVNRPRRSDSEVSAGSFSSDIIASKQGTQATCTLYSRNDSEISETSIPEDFSHEVLTKQGPQMQLVENVTLYAQNEEVDQSKMSPMLSICGADLDAMLSTSLVVNSSQVDGEFDKYDSNQNQNIQKSVEIPVVQAEVDSVADEPCVVAYDNHLNGNKEEYGAPQQNEKTETFNSEITVHLDIEDSFSEVDLCSTDFLQNTIPFSDSSDSISLKSNPTDDITTEVKSDMLPGSPQIEHLVLTSLKRHSSDTNLPYLENHAPPIRRGSLKERAVSDVSSALEPFEMPVKSTKKGRRRTVALVEFDEPKGKLPGKGRIYKDWQKSPKKKGKSSPETRSLDGDVSTKSPLQTTAASHDNKSPSPQPSFQVLRPTKLPENLSTPYTRDYSPSRVPQPQGQGAEPNIKHIFEATKTVAKAKTQKFLGDLKRKITDTIKESLIAEVSNPSLRMMNDVYDPPPLLIETPSPVTETVAPTVVESPREVKKTPAMESTVDIVELMVATKETSEAILKPSIGYNRTKLKAVLEKWIPHLNKTLHNYHQGIYVKKLADYMKERMPTSSSTQVENEKNEEKDHLNTIVGGGDIKRERSPVKYLYDLEVNSEDAFLALHAPIKVEMEEETLTIQNCRENVSSAPENQKYINPDAVFIKDSSNSPENIDFSDFPLDFSNVVYVDDPFSLPKDLHADVSKLVLMCLQLGITGDIRETLRPIPSKEHREYLRGTKDLSDANNCDKNSGFGNSFSENSCACQNLDIPDLVDVGALDASDIVKSATCHCDILQSTTVIFMRCYFHFFNLPKLKRYINLCCGKQRWRLWKGYVHCLHELAQSDPFTNLIRRNELSQIFQTKHNQELIESPSALAHVISLFSRNELKTMLLCADLHKVITPLDVLYMCRETKGYQTLFLAYLDRLLSVLSNTDAARKTLISQLCHEDEVQLAWLECLLDGKPKDTACDCGMPRPFSHTTTWDRSALINTVMQTSQSCQLKSELCRRHGYWLGYLDQLPFTHDRTHFLEILVQLGDMDFLENTLEKYTPLLEKKDFETMVCIKVRQTQSPDTDGAAKPEDKQSPGDNWFCLNCKYQLLAKKTDEHVQDLSTLKLVTWENLARFIVKNIGYQNTLNILQKFEIPAGTLSADFYQTCLIGTIAHQQQKIMVQDVLEKMDNHLWRRKLGYMAPQLEYSVQKEIGAKEGDLATRQMFSVLQGKKELRGQYVEDPACHWGVQTNMTRVCTLCSFPLTDSIQQNDSGLVLFNCGHIFHRYCLPQKLCAVCYSAT